MDALSILDSPRVRQVERVLLLAGLGYLVYRALAALRRGGWEAVLSAVDAIPGATGAIDGVIDREMSTILDEVSPPRQARDVHVELPVHAHLVSEQSTAAYAASLGDFIERALSQDEHASALAQGRAFVGIYHAHVPAPQGGDTAATLHACAPVEAQGDVIPSPALMRHLQALQSRVAAATVATNALYPKVFKFVRACEAEAVSMLAQLVGGGEGVCGVMTSGGTESIFLCMKALRKQFMTGRGAHAAWAIPRTTTVASVPELTLSPPSMVVITSLCAHPALDKACETLGIVCVKLALDADTHTLAPSDVAAALTVLAPRTVAVVASAPCFTHGCVDDIAAIAAVAAAHAVPLHVDNCFGGVHLSMLRAHAADSVPAFDFSAHAGVASMSIDLHKYALAPKGASVAMFRTPALRRMCYYTCVAGGWTGGAYATHTAAGSRSGGPSVAAWASLMFLGRNGLLAVTRRTQAKFASITSALPCVGRPTSCALAIAGCDMAVVARMNKQHWSTAYCDCCNAMHVVVTDGMDVAAFLQDVRTCQAQSSADDAAGGTAGVYGMMRALPAPVMHRVLARYCDALTSDLK